MEYTIPHAPTEEDMKITSKWLEYCGACNAQIELFKEVFPRGATLTKTNLVTAAKAGLDLVWLVGLLVTSDYCEDKIYPVFDNWVRAHLTATKNLYSTARKACMVDIVPLIWKGIQESNRKSSK